MVKENRGVFGTRVSSAFGTRKLSAFGTRKAIPVVLGVIVSASCRSVSCSSAATCYSRLRKTVDARLLLLSLGSKENV